MQCGRSTFAPPTMRYVVRRLRTAAAKAGFHDVPGFPAGATNGSRLRFRPRDDSRPLAHARRRSRGATSSRFAAERESFEGAVRAPLRPEQRKRAARRVPSTADNQFRHQTIRVPRRKASIPEPSLDRRRNYGRSLPGSAQSSVISSARRRAAPHPGFITHER